MTEAWLPVPGFEGFYEVSDAGSIRGLNRVLSDGRRWKGAPVKQKTSKSGHMHVRLCLDCAHHWLLVHRLVLSAFVGPCPVGMEGAHNDGVPGNNHLPNLRWDTRKGNHADKIAHGTSLRGTRNPLSKLTEEQVRGIFDMHARGAKGVSIAAAMGVTPANISSILNGKTWAHIGRQSCR